MRQLWHKCVLQEVIADRLLPPFFATKRAVAINGAYHCGTRTSYLSQNQKEESIDQC